jgi:hypothetical protein
MDAEQLHYLQCGMATPAGQQEAAAEIERLRAALMLIADPPTLSALGMQSVAFRALEPKP